jgi:hypothetical protein
LQAQQHEIYNPARNGLKAKRIGAMVTSEVEREEQEILTFEVSDEALEIAGAASVQAKFTWGVCTMDQPGCPG